MFGCSEIGRPGSRKTGPPIPDLWPLFRARKLGPILGPRRLRGIINGVRLVGPKTSPFFAPFSRFPWPPEALAAWRWATFWEGLCPPSRRVILVNIDETSVPVRESPARGYAHIPPERRSGDILAAEAACTLAARRTYMSLVATLSDDSRAQALLPQVLVTNERTLSKEGYLELQAYLRESTSLFVWRRRSCLLYTSPSPRDLSTSRMPSSA